MGVNRNPGRLKPVTADEFRQMLRLIAEGRTVKSALRQLHRSNAGIFYACLRRRPERRDMWRKAIALSRRKKWPTLVQMESILRLLASNPRMSARTACALNGIEGRVRYQGFLDTTELPEWRDRYLTVKRLQRGSSFDALREEIETAPNLRRAFRRGINQQVNRLTRLEPRRLWPKKQLTPYEQFRRRRARRAKEISDE
jgi:hypothetical protein